MFKMGAEEGAEEVGKVGGSSRLTLPSNKSSTVARISWEVIDELRLIVESLSFPGTTG